MAGRVLVTGGGGFIGRRLVDYLLQRGYTVTVLDRARDDEAARRSVEWVEGDTQDWQRVASAVAGKEYIVHLAAGSNFLMYEQAPLPQTTGAIAGFQNILEAAKRYQVRKIIYASTSAVYEGNPVPYSEGMPLHPPDLKAFAKKVNEEMAHLYSQRFGIAAIGLRPFSVYGPGEVSKGPYANIVSLFTWAMLSGRRPIVWGNGRQTRDFIYVDDAVEAILLALTSNLVTQEINVGTGIETSFNEIIQLLNEQLALNLEPVYMPVPIDVYAKRLLGDTSLASRVLGFKAHVGVREGVRRVVEAAQSLSASSKLTLGEMQERANRLADIAQEPVISHNRR